MYTIYQITNTINQKSYVGFTTKNPPVRRLLEHKWKANRGAPTQLHKSMKKNGFQFFVFVILEQGENSDIGKNIREPHWISVLRPEYNETAGGDGSLGRRHTDKTRHKLAVSMTGKKNALGAIRNEEFRRMVSLYHKGKIVSQETRKNQSIAAKRRWDKFHEKV